MKRKLLIYLLFFSAITLVGIVLFRLFQLEQIIFIKGFTLGETITVVILIIGLLIGMEEAENALRPYVDVGVIFHKGVKKTRFQFLQKSKIPALVWLDIRLRINGRDIDSNERKWWLEDKRLWGVKPWVVRFDNRATSAYALKKVTNAIMETESGEADLFIKISVAPIFRKKARFYYEEKHYEFNKDKDNPRWIETSWGIEDRLHPGFKFSKEDSSHDE
ncbi:MAG TPA: hypothetical protein ENH86_00400 [Candidatus Jorgensenbacteria bacterium]|uniref:Uncharacterized protein n=1 Tax=marine sediment metagenome TaxID=412755 RepID=A0A0F9E7Z5_9ZZZZ|nr:hypothetical protein [Candidatus Jorgensenbacteria bacterium]